MSISSRCRFVVGTIDGKCVSYIVDQPIQPAPLPSVHRPLTSNFAATKVEATSYAEHHKRPISTTTASSADFSINNAEKSNEAKIDASLTLSNEQLDELMDILKQQQGRRTCVLFYIRAKHIAQYVEKVIKILLAHKSMIFVLIKFPQQKHTRIV